APIIGASKPHHLKDALAALELTLTPQQVQQLEASYVPHAVAGI
ncbi:MAG: aldo/keto reductase, partial [Janthinobacterium lividum]